MRLFLPYENMWDMPLGGTSEEKQIPHWFGNFCYIFLGFLFKICFRYTVTGRESLRAFDKKQGVVLVCNHTSFLDTVFLFLSARPSQWVRLIGRDTLFPTARGLVGQALSRVGAFPVKRDKADLKAIKRAAKMLGNNEVIGVFPEGTRRGKGSQEPDLHAGAALIARMGRSPLLPVTVRNAEYIKQKGRRLRFPKVSIEYGSPVLVSDFDFLPKQDRLDACTWYTMRECFALSLNCAPGEVDMRALFPNTKDYTEAFKERQMPVHCSADVVAEEKNVHKNGMD